MADATVGRVLVSLGVDSKPLQDGAKKAEKALENLGRTVDSVGKEAAGDFSKVETAVKDVARTIDTQSDRMAAGFDQVSKSITELSKALRKADEGSQKLQDSNTRATRSLSDMGKSMTSIGSKMSLAITAPMLATGAAAIKLAADFDFAMSSIAGLVGIPQEQVDRMSEKVRNMAKEFGQSAPDAAKALYFVASAGISAANSMNVVEASLKASAIGMGNTGVIADAVSSALNAYGEANLSASSATDLLVASVRRGKMEADTLAGALPRVLPIASAMGVSFQEVGAAFAAMSLNGTDASEAATQIRGILSALLNPTKQAEDQLAKLGLSGSMLRKTIRDDGLLAGLELLTQAFGNNEEAAGVVFGNIRALTGVMSLFGEATAGTKDIFADLADNTGEVDKAFSVMSQTGAFKMAQAMAQMKDAMIGLGQALIPVVLPALKTITGALSGLANGFNNLPGPVKTVGVVIAGLATIAGPVLIGLGAIAKALDVLKLKMIAFQTATPWILGITAALTAAVVVFSMFANSAREARERQERLTDALRQAGDPTVTLTDKVKELVAQYKELSAQSDSVPATFDDVAQSFLYTEALTAGLTDEINTVGLSIEKLAPVVATGTNSFEDLSDSLSGLATDSLYTTGAEAYNLLRVLRDAPADIQPFAQAMANAVEQGVIQGNQLQDIVDLLDKSSDAYDDNREAIDAENKALLTNTDTLLYYGSILGNQVAQSTIQVALAQAEAAGRTDKWTYALEVLNNKAESAKAASDAFLGGLAGLADVLGVDVPNAASTAGRRFESLSSIMNKLRGASEEGKVSFEQLMSELGVLDDVVANRLVVSTQDLTDKNLDLVDALANSSGSSAEVERAFRDQADMIAEAVYMTAQYGGEVEDIAPTLAAMVVQLGDQAQAAGWSDDRIRGLVESLGILDGLEAKFGIAFALNSEELDRQIAQIEQAMGNMIWAAGGGGDTWARLSETLESLRAIRDAVGETRQAAGGRGGGGGGGRTRQEDPFDWVEGWLKDIAKFVEQVAQTEFADDLVASTAPEIAKALERLMDEAVRLGLDKLDTSGTLLGFIQGASEQLQGMANQLDGANGLREQLAKANAEVARLEDNVKGLEQALSDFRRIEMGEGKLSITEQLDEALSKFSQLKSNLQSLQSAYQAFLGEGSDPLERELDRLDTLKASLDDLEQQYADLGNLSGNITPLERERKNLDDLSRSLDNLRQSRLDYQRSTTESLSKISFVQRGGALLQAKRYLSKAQAFRDVITGLRDREFPVSIIKDVVNAGLDGGTALGKKLLSLSDADLRELKEVQRQIGAVAAQTGEVAADVLFTADVSEAEAAFQRQMSLVKAMYEKAIADSRMEYEAQRKIVEGVYQQQIANAQALLDQQAKVVESLYKQALAEAKKQLADAKKVADNLAGSIEDLEDAMRDLIKAIADAVKNASTGSSSSSGGGSSGGSSTRPTGGTTGSGKPIVIGTDDQGTPKPGQVVGGPDRLWGGAGGGGVVDGVYIPPNVQFRAAGGPVTAGMPYIVGELGPELFMPNRSGSIVPNNAGGVTTVTNTYTINVQGGADVGRQVVKAIQEYERRNGNGWRS